MMQKMAVYNVKSSFLQIRVFRNYILDLFFAKTIVS